MKICLVPYPVVTESDNENIDEPKQLNLHVPVGILTIGALLEQAGHQITIIDPVLKNGTASSGKVDLPDPDEISDIIKTNSPDLVGFSTIFSTYPLVIKWTERFHNLSPDTPILLGGPQASAVDEQTLQAFPWINMILRGETENSIVLLINCMQSGGDLASVPGLTWRNGSQIIRNRNAAIETDIDNIPFPAYHLYPMKQVTPYYNTKIGRYYNHFPLEAGRGCPFNCSFCSSSDFFSRHYRAKSVGRLINEIIFLHTKYGLNHFDLYHDLFTCNRTYVLQFCNRIRERGLQNSIYWHCNSRADTIDRKLLEEMAGAGCSGISYGIETGSSHMQQLIGKKLSIDRVRAVVKDTLSLGIHVSASFICGFPQESVEDLRETFTLIMNLINDGVDQTVLLPLFPLVSSKLYREFGDTIIYDGPWSSDILHGCLSSEDEEKIVKWPQIFAGFYHYKTPGLNNDMLRALVRIINRYSRLLAALSAEKIDVMSVFEDWPKWYNIHVSCPSAHYYRQKTFYSDFLNFLTEEIKGNTNKLPQINDLIRWHSIYERVNFNTASQVITETFSIDVLALLSHLVDKSSLDEQALRPTTYVFGKINGKMIAKPLIPALEDLLKINSNNYSP